MEIDKILITGGFSLIGVIIGWLLNQLGSWFRARGEDKRNLKGVLYQLLESYHLLGKHDFQKFVDRFLDKLLADIPLDQQAIQKELFKNTMLPQLVENFIKPILLGDLKNIESKYDEAIGVLSKIDPLTAYYLGGRNRIPEQLSAIENWVEGLSGEQISMNDVEQSKKFLGILTPTLLQDILDDMKEDIISIAWKINPVIWFKTKRILKRMPLNASEVVDKKVDEIIRLIKTSQHSA